MFSHAPRLLPLITAVTLGLLCAAAPAQNGRPRPASADPSTPETTSVGADAATPQERPLTEPSTVDGSVTANAGAEIDERVEGDAGRTRPRLEGEVTLFFDDVSVEEIMPFIVEATGKVVMPVRLQTLKSQKITLINDKPIPRAEALDLVFTAFRLNEIGVVELDEKIIIGAISDIVPVADLAVLGPSDDIMVRKDLGNFVVKVFRLEKADAESIGSQLEENLPDYASITIDTNSNQLVVVGDVGLCQHLQQLITELDRTHLEVKTKTYRLSYADASEIADNIDELFMESGTGASRSSAARSSPRTPQRGGTRGGGNASQVTGQPGPTAELRLTVNQQQNTVTVQADPTVVENIDILISEYWDLPRPAGTQKLYRLRYTDPIVARDMLQELLESGGSAGGARGASGRGGAGGASRGGVNDAIRGIYRLEAYSDSNSLLVLCKTEESFNFLDSIIDSLDQPSTVGLPVVIELKHADAIDLADELNVLLSIAGSSMTLDAPETGLSASGGLSSGDGAGEAIGGGREVTEGREIRFPWQQGRQNEEQSPETPLIGKTRIVPIIRQNALAVLAPPQYQEHVRELIHFLDRPGKQVMISAIIAEVELGDDLSLGLRVSSDDLSFASTENVVQGALSSTNQKEDVFSSLFDTSILDFNFDLNVALQALAEETNVRVLQEPRVFTADNQEAVFFDGQDVPFSTGTINDINGGSSSSTDYRQVGVVLNCRPRITAEQDVDMEIYLELSSIVPGVSIVGNPVVDRRSTTTQVVVKNGQTIVLSGILQDIESKVTRKVPFFGDIPLLGELFTSRENSTTTTELVAFITPIVVEHPSENDYNFNEQDRQRLRQLTSPLSEQAETLPERVRDRIVTPKDLQPLIESEDAENGALKIDTPGATSTGLD
ncbi:MAG: secretin N-terminal domain-containing protein [Planctomycetota bacterium]